MYGFINTCLKSMVIDKFGEDTWDKLRNESGVQDTFMTYEVYGDDITMRLVAEACKLLDVEPNVVLRQFGEYFFEFCKRSGYDHMLRTLGGNLFEFIENLDALHSYLTLSYKEMNAPSFRVEKNTDDTMLLHYYSDRRGLCHIVPGIIGAVAKDFFDSEITMDIVNQIEEEERTGKKEHVVFLVTQKPRCLNKNIRSDDKLIPAQPFLSPSCQHKARQDTELPLRKTPRLQGCATRRNHWETIRGLVCLGKGAADDLYSQYSQHEHLAPQCDAVQHNPIDLSSAIHTTAAQTRTFDLLSFYRVTKAMALHLPCAPGKLLRGFEPVYPETLWIDLQTFCNAFPFHIVFDEELRVKQAGVNVQKIVPGLQTMLIRLDQYFTILHPEVTFTISSIRKFINSQFVLRTRRDMMPESWRDRPMLELRGQMVWMETLQCMLYLASPLLRSLHELEERRMHISDIAPHDVTRDLILLNQQRLAEMELSNQLERKKEELRHLSQHLEEEKKKTETLLYAMLPKHVANQLKEGKRVEAGEFKECTILFSDVVTFTNICSECEPIKIVFMLNSMYLKFDRLTTVHNVYKVETIGDAYMVVGGVPIPVSSHAERVANFALGMIIAAREVINPITGDPIQIRVGVHTGPVLAGVVGEKMPRYCLFGDAVNTASRMESHGLPNKIHLSPMAYQALKGKGFRVLKRGEIEVKGKGRMQTYFLDANLIATENQIMGRSLREAPSGLELAPSQRESDADVALYRPGTRTLQRVQSVDRRPTVPMRYGDSVADSRPFTLPCKPQPQSKCLADQPRDSESYGSLQSDHQSEDDPYQLLVESAPTEAMQQATNVTGHKRIRTSFCAIL